MPSICDNIVKSQCLSVLKAFMTFFKPEPNLKLTAQEESAK